jgi:hypothetical protein
LIIFEDAMKNITKQNVKSWQDNSAAAFRKWLTDVQPCVLHRNGQYKIFKAIPEQNKIINQILSSKNKRFKHSMSIVIQPRRHGKSSVLALICLWLFTSRRNFTIQLLGNTEVHCRRVQFNTLVKIIRNTPVLNQAIKDDDIRQYEIRFPALGNVIQLSPQNAAASFGDRLNLLWVSDLHAAADLGPFNALQAALLDSDDSLCLIDSNIDHTDGPIHALQREADDDPSIFCSYLCYENIDDYLKRAPAWLDRAKATRLQRTTLPAEFARDILGKRMDAKNALFPSEVIELCKSPYKIPVADINEITKGRAHKVGGGLDRSKSLFQGPKGDATVWTTILKVASPEHGEPEFYILNQQKINPNTSRGIKKAIIKDHESYKLDNVVLENYETADLAPWLADQGIPHELVSAHDTNQNASFPEFYRIAKEGRFHFSDSLKDLESEMRTFTYTQRAGGKYSFGHASTKFHDDHVYSVNWAIFSLRSAVLNVYTLGNFHCLNRSPRRKFCFLMGGGLKMLCSSECFAYKRVESMLREFKQFRLESELTVQEFFHLKVKREGVRIQQAL